MLKISSLLFLLLLFTGCANRVCGIDREFFSTFSKTKQERICDEYMKTQNIIQKRYLIEKENRKKELELELKKAQSLYSNEANVLSLEVSGEIFFKKRVFKIYSYSFNIAKEEIKRVCLNSFCFWTAYENDRLYINIIPGRRGFLARYKGGNKGFYTTKESVVLQLPLKETRVKFKKDGALYDLVFRFS
jgi:hypothetical protein